MDTIEVPGMSVPAPPARVAAPPRGAVGIAMLGQVYTILAYGLIGFGILLFGAPGLLLYALSGGGGSGAATVGGVVLAGALIVGAILAATFLVRDRVARGDTDGARLPALALAVGNLGVALAGGLLSFNVLAALGVVGAAIYFAEFALLDGAGAPSPPPPLREAPAARPAPPVEDEL